MRKLIIIGLGPAGLSAAIYAARAGLEPLVIGSSLGGQAAVTSRIENYPGFPKGIQGMELARLMRDQAERFGAEIEMKEAKGIELSSNPFLVRTHGGEYKAKALIMATGTSPRKLKVPGEAELTGRGVSYCATCDGFFYKDRKVAVVGGGDTAIEEALFLTKFARQVYIVHRRHRLRASQILQERAFDNEKVKFIWDSVATEVLGQERVTGVALKNAKTGERTELSVDGVFVSIGQIPNTRLFEGRLELDERGYIVTDKAMHTSVDGVFAAGDVQERVLQQVATAVGTGAIAAMEAEKFIATLEGRAYPERTD